MKTRKLWIVLSILLTQAFAWAGDISNAEGLIRAMQARYAKSWYETLSFTQKSTTYNADGTTKVETWYEAAMLPGKLRIDVGPASDGNAFLLSDGTVTIFKAGQRTDSRPFVNMLLVLGFDVYRQAPEATLKVIAGEKYDLTKFHTDTWEGKPVYVVGADRSDLKSRQFWVEKDRLLFVRLFQPAREDPSKIDDIRFTNYRPLAGGWLAPRVEVHADGTLVFSEDYSAIQANPKLEPAFFDPKSFVSREKP